MTYSPDVCASREIYWPVISILKDDNEFQNGLPQENKDKFKKLSERHSFETLEDNEFSNYKNLFELDKKLEEFDTTKFYDVALSQLSVNETVVNNDLEFEKKKGEEDKARSDAEKIGEYIESGINKGKDALKETLKKERLKLFYKH